MPEDGDGDSRSSHVARGGQGCHTASLSERGRASIGAIPGYTTLCTGPVCQVASPRSGATGEVFMVALAHLADDEGVAGGRWPCLAPKQGS